ncbi:MAG TPA: DNA polymerase Y family protein [Ottowia sp.]|uniref:DNA polymerase Y family protein n=1 Tax=Ottowia sp. TaxID=1898956 RepID=UPI002CDB3A58|nr:DNA polymerase Y family protein [Ottowia sp.]HMN22788.1 DNA polymerase Y family protein [Ottowia sp.]
MQWIALQWPPEASPARCLASEVGTNAARQEPRRAPDEALAWWALQFTPRVARVDEALLLEVSGSLRLWGGLRALMRRIETENLAPPLVWQAQSGIGLVALAELRLRAAGLRLPPPAAWPEALPLEVLSAARPHLGLLARLGCRSWGQVHALPRAGLVRRCGPQLRAALDVAFGLAPESYPWLTLPERFDQQLDLQTHVDNAPALLWAAARLLTALQHWLRARQLGVLALELAWTLDRRRLDGQPLPPGEALVVRTAEPAQAMEHLRRLLAERLARVQLAAPAVRLRLRALETAPWQASSHSLLPGERRAGEPLHVFVERVSARLGPQQVLAAEPQADHRPERRQRWRPAQQALQQKAAPVATPAWADALAPTWLLPEPLPLAEQGGRPLYHGPLQLLAGPRRIEAGWWPQEQASEETVDPVSRDYYVARNPASELLWVFRERPTARQPQATPRWFLHGLYA